MERPRFRTEVSWQRNTFFGATSQMKSSQWSTLPQIDDKCQNVPASSSVRSHGKSCSLPALCESRPDFLSKRELLHSQQAPAAKEPVPNRTAWMHGRWGAGSQSFGAPPLAKLNGRMLHARIGHLEKSVAKAHREAFRLSYEVGEQSMEYRGFVQAEQRNLEQELLLCHDERERRLRLRQGKPGPSMKRGVRCVAVPDDSSQRPRAAADVELDPEDGKTISFEVNKTMKHSASEPALQKRILKEAASSRTVMIQS